MKEKVLAWLRLLWEKAPFRQMTALTLALFIIKERFPFSNFPMYSNIDEDAEVAFVTDQDDKPVAMRRLFRTGTATAKKMFLKEIRVLSNLRGKNNSEGTPEERKMAGKAVLDTLMPRLNKNAVPPGAKAVRLYILNLRAGGGKISELPHELVAEHPL